MIDPTQTAYAAIWAVNHAGRSIIAEWTSFKPLAMKIEQYDPSLANDTVGAMICTHYSAINRSGTALMFSKFLPAQRTGFTVSNLQPSAGSTIQPDQQISFDICYSSKDTISILDTAFINIDCYQIPVVLVGSAKAPIIDAEDVAFNGVDVGDTACKTVRVWNRGSGELVLSGKSTSSEFTLIGSFPDRIPPYSFQDYSVCFIPKGSYGTRDLTIAWTTNEPSVYAHGNKDVTLVTGISYARWTALGPRQRAF